MFQQKLSLLLALDSQGSRCPTLRNAWPTENRALDTVSAQTGFLLGDVTPS